MPVWRGGAGPASPAELAAAGPDKASPDKASERQSVFTLVNAVLGAGVLGYPFCYKVGAATLAVGGCAARSLWQRRLRGSCRCAPLWLPPARGGC